MFDLPVPRWIALLACLMASAVPAAGLVICLHEGELEIGIGNECACDLPDGHPDCDHVEVDGGGDTVAAAPRVPGPTEMHVVGDDSAVEVVEGAALLARGGREPPPGRLTPEPWGSGELPWIARHLLVRRTTSLLV